MYQNSFLTAKRYDEHPCPLSMGGQNNVDNMLAPCCYTVGPPWPGDRTSQAWSLYLPGSGNCNVCHFSFPFSSCFIVFLAFSFFSLRFHFYQSVQNIKTLLYMSSTVENFKFPLGTRDNPAMTCKELMDIDDIRDGEKLASSCVYVVRMVYCNSCWKS